MTIGGISMNAGEMLTKGLECYKGDDVNGAADWWEKAAEAGSMNAAYNLIQVIYSRPERGLADPQKYMKMLEKLANEHNNGWAKVMLGTIYCGDPQHIQIRRALFEKDVLAEYVNPFEGLSFLESGIPLAEAEGSIVKLCYEEYSAISFAYWELYIGAYKGVEKFKAFNPIYGIRKAIEFRKKEIENIVLPGVFEGDPQYLEEEYLPILKDALAKDEGILEELLGR
jgi:TPR repeat protein